MTPGPFRSPLEVHRGTRRGDSLNPVIGGSATLHLGVNLFPSTWSREVRIQSTTRVGTAMKFNDQRSSFQPWKWVQTRAFAGSLTYLPISTNSRTFRQNSVKFSRKRSSAYRAIFLWNGGDRPQRKQDTGPRRSAKRSLWRLFVSEKNYRYRQLHTF
jgi:hypothetical protein